MSTHLASHRLALATVCGVLNQGKHDPKLHEHYMEMVSDVPTSKPVQDLIDNAVLHGLRVGTPVRLTNSVETGYVVGYNTRLDGLYTGKRYPIYVKFVRGTFKYEINNLEIVNRVIVK